jgi:hypothetical protein
LKPKPQRISIRNCNSCRCLPRDPEKYRTQMIAMRGHWMDPKEPGSWLEAPPKVAKTYTVGLTGPLEFEIGDTIWIFYATYEYALNHDLGEKIFDNMRLCEGKVKRVSEMRKDGLDIRFAVQQVLSFKEIVELHAPVAPIADWEYWLKAIGSTPSLSTQHGPYTYASANSQGDVGYNIIFLEHQSRNHIVFINDWCMHEDFIFAGNYLAQ